MNPFALVSDFDGTITGRDFYELIAERYMPRDPTDYFAEYRKGRRTHFEAMQAFFRHAPSDPVLLEVLLRETEPDPHLAASALRLEAAGWDLIIVSAGCSWYIERILAAAGVSAVVHSNPGRIEPGRGLVLRLPTESPFFSPDTGIDKCAVVRDAQSRYRAVAFAGDGAPDIRPALLVPPANRFARRFLAQALESRGEPCQPFEAWSQIVETILSSTACL
jgi:2,3-diketo-5-methylthio-1-phosphopentane phosphatase